MRQATTALGFYEDGYWFRRFVNDPDLSGIIDADRASGVAARQRSVQRAGSEPPEKPMTVQTQSSTSCVAPRATWTRSTSA